MIAQKTAAPSIARRGCTARVPAAKPAFSPRHVAVRFRDGDRNADVKRQLENQLKPSSTNTQSKLSDQQVQDVVDHTNISRRDAEMRADLGDAIKDKSWEVAQAFDGPAPETINSRLAMLGVVIGLAGEWFTGLGLMEQTADHPITVFLSFVLISIASYVPIYKGYTRKEPFANNFLGLSWTPKAENWNGRLAMMGFAAMVLIEWIAGCNTLQAWGLQPLNFHLHL